MGKSVGKSGPARVGKSGSGTGSGTKPPRRARDNSEMQGRLAQDGPAKMDEGAAGLLGDFSRFQAEYATMFGQAVGLAAKAHGAQDSGDVPGYHANVDALLDTNTAILWQLDWFLPGFGITEQLSYYIDEHPEQAQIPEFYEGVLKVASFAEFVKSHRSFIIPFLIPRSVHGRGIPAIPSLPLGDLSFTEAVEGQVGALEPMLTAAEEIRALLADARDAKGAAASALATEVVAGAMSDYEPGSGEFEYLYQVVANSPASSQLKARVDWLLGRDDFDPYAGDYGIVMAATGMVNVAQEVLQGTQVAPAGASGAGTVAGAGPAAAKKPPTADELAAARSSGKTPGVPEFDTSKLPEEEKPEEEHEGTVKGYAGNRGRQRVETTYARDGKMTVGDGKVGGEASGTRKVERRDGSSNVAGVEGSLEAGETLSGAGKVSASRKTRDGGSLGGSVGGGRDAEGNLSGQARIQGGYADRDGNGATYGKTVGYSEKDGATMGTDVTVNRKNGDGSTTATTGGVNVSTKGNVSANVGQTTTMGNGDKRTTGGSAGYDAESGAVNVAVKRTNVDKDGNDKGSMGGSGSVDLDGSDGKTGAKGSFSASKGGKSVTVSGGYSVNVAKPVQEGGRWVVTWETDLSGKVGGGVEGKKGGASANMGVGKKKTGRKSFKSQAEADAFFANPKLDGMPGVDDAAQMAEGDTRGTEKNFDLGADGSAKIGMAEIGVGGSHSQSSYETVTKGKGGKVRVEVGRKELDEVHGSVGLAGVSGGMGKSWASHESLTVEFDLDTPEGKNAYAHHQRFRSLPRGARGWRIVGTAKGGAETDSYNLGLLGVKVGSSHTVSSSVEYDEGNKYERDAGTDATSVSVPLLGSYARSHKLSMLQVNDGRSFYNTESTVKASGLGDVRKGLARSAMESEQGTGGSNKGTYRLQSAISEADMDTFIGVATSSDARAKFLYNGGNHAADGLDELRSGLRKAAGDRDAQRKVLARWVADEGYDALTVLHAITHGKFDQRGEGGTQMFVAIDGDPYMDGMKGQLDLELRIQAWDGRLKGGERGPGLASEIRKDLTFQRQKARHLETCSELPYRVFAQEFDRVRRNVTILDSILQRSLTGDGAASPGSTALESPKFAAFRRATANLSVARGECEHVWGHVYTEYRINETGAFQSGDARRAEHFPKERANFDKARALWFRAENARQGAIMAESLSGQTLDERSVAPLTALVTKARSEYLRSKRFYEQVAAIYDDISMRTIGKGPHVGYYGQRVTPGQ